MSLLARRNLFHDKVQFAVTLTGIVFALVLIIIQFGLFLGFTTTTSNNIDHSNADLWVVFRPGSGLGEPWNMVQGSVADLKQEDSVIVDELYREKLGVERIGDRIEIGDHRARVVGFT